MLRCSLKFNPQSVIDYQQLALWVKMSNIIDLNNKERGRNHTLLRDSKEAITNIEENEHLS